MPLVMMVGIAAGIGVWVLLWIQINANLMYAAITFTMLLVVDLIGVKKFEKRGKKLIRDNLIAGFGLVTLGPVVAICITTNYVYRHIFS
jgi:hypothetical protein